MPIHPLQAMIDGINAANQRVRSESGQMTLGALIEALGNLPPETPVMGLGDPESYRGYYSDLAFRPTTETRTAADLLTTCREAMGETFEGYKGGDFMMGARTPLWVSAYGTASGDRLMGLDITDGIARPVTEQEER